MSKTSEKAPRPIKPSAGHTESMPATPRRPHESAEEVYGESQDFDSVILPANLDADDAKEPRRGAAAAPAALGPPPRLAPVDPQQVRDQVLADVGPEHFRRTLIAAGRPVLAGQQQSSAVASPRAVQIEPREVPTDLADPRLVLLREPDSARAASLRVLRHRLAERGDPRTIVVTSADTGDGKTTCAANLAVALSECGRARVLLLEANFRNPGLAQVMGIKPPACLTRQIQKQHRDPNAGPWIVAQISSPWLHLLAIDPEDFASPRLLDGPAFENALTQLKLVGYDYIVLDTPAVLSGADVNLVQDMADGVLLVMRARKSSTRALRRALDQLTSSKIIGAVLLDT